MIIEREFEKNTKGVRVESLKGSTLRISGLEDFEEVTYSISLKEGGYLKTIKKGALVPSEKIEISLDDAKSNSILLVNGKNKGKIVKQVEYLIVELPKIIIEEHRAPNELTVGEAKFVKELRAKDIALKTDIPNLDELKNFNEKTYAKKEDIKEVDLSEYMPLSQGLKKSDALQFAKASEVAVLKQQVKKLEELIDTLLPVDN